MRALEKILLILCLIGIGMDLFNMEGGIVIMLLGISLLTLLYLGLTWLLIRDSETRSSYPAISIPTGIVLSITCLAIVHKLLLWPGREEMLMIALILLAPLTIIILIIYRRKNASEGSAKACRKILQRLIPFFIVAGSLFFIPDRSIIYFKYGKDPELARLLSRAVEHPDNEQYWRDLEDHQLNKYFNTDTLNR